MPTIKYRVTGARPYFSCYCDTAKDVRQLLECEIWDMEDCSIDDIPLKDFLTKIETKFDCHTFCLDRPDEEVDKRIAEVLGCPI